MHKNIADLLVHLATVIVAILVSTTAMAQAAQPQSYLFTNVMVFDGTSETLRDVDVLVSGNTISQISEEPLAVIASTNMTVIDGGGRTLMPGLIDTHVHWNMNQPGLKEIESARWDRIASVSAGLARDWLMDGFTTARGMGGNADGLKKTIDEGTLAGPRFYPSGGYISQTSGHGDLLLTSQQGDPALSNLLRLGLAQLADGPDEVRAAVRRNFANGASQIKIMVGGGVSSEKGPLFAPQYTDAEITAAVEEAATRDTYVAVHVYQDAHVKRAIELGVKSIEHGQFISEKTARLMKKEDVFISPFLAGVLSDQLFTHPLYGKEGSPQNIKAKEMKRDAGNFIEIIKKVKPKLGFAVDVVMETIEQGRQHRDHEKWIWADSFGNHAALVAMTSSSAELVALSGRNNPYPGKLGVIEEGALADILLVDGNPLEDITAIGGNPKWFDAEPRGEGIETIRLIMKDGKIYKNTL